MIRIALLSCLAFSLPVVAADSGLAWRKGDQSTALCSGARVVWQFNHGPEDSKPSFHPIALVGGSDLTWFRPQDHPWHRGLWFSWKFINGVNYWEEDKSTGKAAGETHSVALHIDTRADFSATIRQQLAYRPAGGETVLKEDRAIRISPPDADGGYTMDWDLAFTAVGDALLDRTPLPSEPDGKVFGGYAGLSIRLAKEITDVKAISSAGPCVFESERFRGKSPFLDYTGRVDGKEVGIAMFDHPSNLNSPSPWYVINGAVMHYYSPAVICYGPHKLKAGDRLHLRYRIAVHPGRWESKRLEQESARFANP
jgi:hypothetical protein